MEERINKIIKLIGDIGEKVSQLQPGKSIPSIERDIILGNIRSLYEDVKNFPSGTDIPVVEKNGMSTDNEKEIRPEKDHGSKTAAKTDSSEAISAADKEPADEAVLTEEQAIVAEEKDKPRADEKPSDQIRTEALKPGDKPTTLGDRYKGGKKFMNESLAEQGKKEDISSKIQSKPIQNIGSALGINDRFKLINDLFNGDKSSFDNTINVLDGASNFNEAFNFINTSFDWDMEGESVQLILELVRRKFIVNQNE